MELFEDYYELLQVHHRAELAVIEAAYKKLAHKYHPDHNDNPRAASIMKRINHAHDTLCHPVERKNYDILWKKHFDKRQAKPVSNPELVVLPKYIRFKDLGYGEIKTTYFDVKNTGGLYTNYSIEKDNLPPWLKITGIQPLSSNILPLRVHIKAIGQYKGTKYECFIPVRLENSHTGYRNEVKVRIEMVMKAPVLQFDRKSLEFYIMPNTISVPHIVTLRNIGMCSIEGNLFSRQHWIKISPRTISFTDKQDIQVQVDASKLYNDVFGYIDVKTNCGDDVLAIHVRINRETAAVKKKIIRQHKIYTGSLYQCPECKYKTVRLNISNHRYECMQCRSHWPASELAYS